MPTATSIFSAPRYAERTHAGRRPRAAADRVSDPARRRPSRGFTLIEVLVALALLGGVLLTIGWMFVLGSQAVRTGRDLSDATVLGTNILEEIDGWGFAETYRRLGASGGETALSTDTITGAYARAWQPMIAARLPDSRARIEVAPLGGESLDSARGLRVTVTVEWVLKMRARRVSLVTARF